MNLLPPLVNWLVVSILVLIVQLTVLSHLAGIPPTLVRGRGQDTEANTMLHSALSRPIAHMLPRIPVRTLYTINIYATFWTMMMTDLPLRPC